MNDNVIMAVYNHNTEITTKANTQWNRGQILKIEGIYNLPAAFEVEVSNDRERGAKRYLGHDYEFVIPDEYFESGKMIYIWIMKRVEPTDITSKYNISIEDRKKLEQYTANRIAGLLMLYLAKDVKRINDIANKYNIDNSKIEEILPEIEGYIDK